MMDLVTGDDGLARCFWGSGAAYVAYHDEEWGRPVRGDDALFERLTLEAFQSGLSWLTILRKRPAFRRAFDGFSISSVAAYTDADVTRLLGTSTARNALPDEGTEKASGQAARPAGCPGPGRPGATTLPIRYDGVLSALVVHPEKSGRRLVEVWDCGGQARLATAQVPQQD